MDIIRRILSDLALADNTFLMPVQHFYRILNRDDMPAAAVIDRVDQTGQRRGFPAARCAGDQHQSLFQLGKRQNFRTDMQLIRIGQDEPHNPQHRGQRSALTIDIHTEPSHLRKRKGKIILAHLMQPIHRPVLT